MINIPRSYKGIRATLVFGVVMYTSNTLAQDLSNNQLQIEHIENTKNPYKVIRNKSPKSGELTYCDDICKDELVQFSHNGIITHGNKQYQLGKQIFGGINLCIYDIWRDEDTKRIHIKAGTKLKKKTVSIAPSDFQHMMTSIIQGKQHIVIGKDDATLTRVAP